MLSKLIPCPFCGYSEVEIICIEGIKAFVVCQECGVIANFDRWNCRNEEEVLKRRNQKLLDALLKIEKEVRK